LKKTPEIRGKGFKLWLGGIKGFYGKDGCSEEAQSFSLEKTYVIIERTGINKKNFLHKIDFSKKVKNSIKPKMNKNRIK
jgi:hypothetical protein